MFDRQMRNIGYDLTTMLNKAINRVTASRKIGGTLDTLPDDMLAILDDITST